MPQIRYKKPWDRESQDKKKLADRRAMRKPFIYFFRCRTFIKIGWTTDMAHRRRSIQCSNPDEIVLAGVMLGGEREELALHRALRSLYHRGEWFRDQAPLTDLITLISPMRPDEARRAAGDWFLEVFGKTDLLFSPPTAQKPEPAQRINNEIY